MTSPSPPPRPPETSSSTTLHSTDPDANPEGTGKVARPTSPDLTAAENDNAIPTAPISVPHVAEGAPTDEKEAEENPRGDLRVADPESAEDMIDGRPRDVYDTFSKGQKRAIVAIASYSAFISPVTSSVFLPAIPQISRDLNTTPAVINYTVAIFIVVIGVAPLIWSPMSGFYGRRPIYLASMPIMVAASIGVANSYSVGAIIGTRILQGCGSSAVLAVGAGTIGDIFRPSERANAMGWFYTGALLGPALAPVIAGLFSEYSALTWRSTQYFLVGCASLAVILTALFLPETHHHPIPHREFCKERGKKFVPYIFNPLSILGLFRWPNICAITFISSCTLLQTYALLVPLSVVFQDRFNIHNIAISGTLFLSSGVGNIIGARIAGPWADWMVARYLKKRGHRRPEDRLRAAILALGVIIPLSCLGYGWVVQYSAGGLAPPLVFLTINGVGVMMVFTPVNTYAVDSMQKRSAEVIAVNNFVRYLFSAAASAFVIPLADAIGWGWTMTFSAGVAWLACGVILLTIRYGHIWRERANERYGYNNGNKDEQHPDPSSLSQKGEKDEEAAISTASSDVDAHSHHSEHHDTPGSLVALNPVSGRTRGKERLDLSRNSTRTELPDVEEVLKRTVSLSGASVHGGA